MFAWLASVFRKTHSLTRDFALASVCLLSYGSTFAADRTPWTTSKLTGSPEPEPPFRAEVVWPELTFDDVLDAARLPEAKRVFLAARKGKVWSVPDDFSLPEPAPRLFADLRERVPAFKDLFGMTFHPEHAENREVFFFYVDLRDGAEEPRTRVGRFKTTGKGEDLRIEPESEEILISFGSGGHNGGHLQFGPEDGMLYFALGDLAPPSPPDPELTGQDVSDLAGSILRIDVSRRDAGRGLAYGIPPDNPFLDLPGARPEVWAYGLRNPWKMCFHPRTNDLWVADVGWESWELLHKVERGGNYGWSVIEGPMVVNPKQETGPSPITPPVVNYSHVEGASITGGYVSETPRLPKLRGAYLYGDYVTGRLWGMWHDGEKLLRNEIVADTRQRIVTFGQAAAGEVFFLNWPKKQNLFRLARNPEAEVEPVFPTKLSETGLFADLAEETPAPGVEEFFIRSPMWADGASARRWLAVPGAEGFQTERHVRRGALQLRHRKPKDTAAVKTLYLDGRRVETQVLHFDGYWRGYSFRWNEAQTDADLVPKEGLDATIGGKPWRFSSRQECLRCHGGNFNYLFAFHPGQLNRDRQLDRLYDLGLVDEKFRRAAEAQPLVSPYDEDAPLDLRARSWLHANCSHCHRVSGGGSVPFQANVEPALDGTGLLGESALKGDFGLRGAPKLIVPGDPYASVLYYRSATTGPGHMPMLGAKTIDARGLRVLHDWILSLEPEGAGQAPPKLPKKGEAVTPSQALRIAHLLDLAEETGKGKGAPSKKRLLQAARNAKAAEAVGVLERFLRE